VHGERVEREPMLGSGGSAPAGSSGRSPGQGSAGPAQPPPPEAESLLDL